MVRPGCSARSAGVRQTATSAVTPTVGEAAGAAGVVVAVRDVVAPSPEARVVAVPAGDSGVAALVTAALMGLVPSDPVVVGVTVPVAATRATRCCCCCSTVLGTDTN